MSYRNFADEMKKGLPLSSYLLAASDPFLHSEALMAIKGLVPAAEMDFSFLQVDMAATGSSLTPVDHVIDALNTVPFFSGRKFVIIENFQKLLKKELKKFSQYLANPSSSSVMIALYSGTVKKETKENTTGAKQIILDISEGEVPLWLRTKAGTKGLELSEDALDYLIGLIGTDLGLLSSELDKFTLLGKQRVEKEDIREITEAKRTYSAFALVDAIRAKDPERAFLIYRVLRETEEPYSLLGALNWQYARQFGENNSPKDRAYYCDVFKVLNKADVDIKSSGGSYPVELLLVRLLKLSRQR